MMMKWQLSLAVALGIGMATFPSSATAQVRRNMLYNQQTYISTHNSFANHDDGYQKYWQNQSRSIKRQLEDGVRCIGLDIWTVKQRKVALTWHYLYKDKKSGDWKASKARLDDVIYNYNNVLPEIVTGHAIDIAGYNMINGVGTGNNSRHRPLSEALNQIADFLRSNPNEVVTLSFESYVTDPNLLRKYFADAGLLDMIFYADRPNRFPNSPYPELGWDVRLFGWPTIQDMINNNKRLVVFTDNPQGDRMPSFDDYVVAGPGGGPCFDPYKATEKKALGSYPLNSLFIELYEMGWTVDQPLENGQNVAQYNSATQIFDFWTKYILQMPGTTEWNPRCGRVPNYVSVDFYERTGPFGRRAPVEVVHNFNYQWNLLDGPATILRVSDVNGDVVNGWHSGDVQLSVGNWGVNNPNRNFCEMVKVSATALPGRGGQTIGQNVFPDTQHQNQGGITQKTLYPYATLTEEGVTLVARYGINRYGRVEPCRFSEIKIDKNPPATKLTTTAASAAPWDAMVTLTATDSYSGVDQTYYSVDGGPDRLYTRPFRLSPGVHNVYYWSVDRVGHVESAKSADLFIGPYAGDTAPPITTGQAYLGGSSIGPVTAIVLTAVDQGAPTSGIETTFYKIDGGSEQIYERNFLVYAPGWHTVSFHSIDKAGNIERPRSLEFFNGLDDQPPVTTATVTEEPSKVHFSLSATDAGAPPSGIDKTYYRINGGTEKVYVQEISLPREEGVLEYRSIDRLGNQEEWKRVRLAQTPKDVTNSPVTVTLGSLRYDRGTGLWKQPVTLTNTNTTEFVGEPISLLVEGLVEGITLVAPTGQTQILQPIGTPYVNLTGSLPPGGSQTITLSFQKTVTTAIKFTPRVIAYPGLR